MQTDDGAEIIPHELDRYHERVRSSYEIITDITLPTQTMGSL